MIIDLKIYSNKTLLLNFFMNELEDMYSPNYDALIDVLGLYEGNITFINYDQYDDLTNLNEIILIIKNDNPKINFIIK